MYYGVYFSYFIGYFGDVALTLPACIIVNCVPFSFKWIIN